LTGTGSRLCSVLASTGVKDDRVLAILVEQLTKEPVVGAGNLAQYGDPRAIPHLSRALDDYEMSDSDHPFANQAVIELHAAIEGLGGELSETQQEKLRQAVKPGDEWRAKMDEALGAHSERERESDSDQPRRKLGRNDRCWCGSGKKYKKCHLGSDEDVEQALRSRTARPTELLPRHGRPACEGDAPSRRSALHFPEKRCNRTKL
jgi:hypothetical protein